MIFKLLIGLFDALNFGDLLTKAQRIKVALNSEPALTLLPDPWPATYPTRADITAAYTAYETAFDTAQDGTLAHRDARDDKRLKLIQVLKDAAPYFEVTAKAANDLTILDATGYDRRRPIAPIPQPLPAPVLKMQRNGMSGLLIGRAKAVAGAKGYEGQLCVGTDTQEANWHTALFNNGCSHLQFNGLIPGQVYSFRLRALGRDGWGAWSNVVQLMAV